jgi:uncharacterized membrane protein YgaE (UPF0421/DUF939 family)
MVRHNFDITKKLGIYRIFGTIAGAIWAIASWYAFGTNPYGLFFMILFFVAPLNYICFATRYTKLAFVSMITLIVVLFSKKTNIELHSLNTDPIEVLAYKRATEGEYRNISVPII